MSIANETLYTWTQTPGARTCLDSAALDAQTMEYAWWLATCTPGNTATACGGLCDCRLIMTTTEIQTINPYIPPGAAAVQGETPPLQVSEDETILEVADELITPEGQEATDPSKVDSDRKTKDSSGGTLEKK